MLNNRVFPLIERYSWIWVWPGEASKADAASLPDCGVMEQQGWTNVYGDFDIKADYHLILDNFLDLTHVGYVHQGTIGTADVAAAPMDVQVEENTVNYQRYVYDVPVPSTFF